MAINVSTSQANSFASAYKAATASASSAPSGSVGATYKNSSGQLINSGGQVVGGAVTSGGQLTNDGKNVIPGTSKYVDNNLNGNISTGTITPQSLAPATPINLPGAPLPTQSASYYNNLTSGAVQAPGTPITVSPEDKQKNMLQEYADSLGTPPSSEVAYKAALKESDFLAKQQRADSLSAQLNGIVANSQAQQLALEGQGRGQTASFVGGEQARIAREAAITSLPIAAQLSAAQNDVARAQSQLDTLFKIKSEDARNQYEYRKDIVGKMYEIATTAEKRRLDAIDKNEDRVYKEGQDNLKLVEAYSAKAIENGEGYLIQSLTAINPKSPTFRQDLAKVTSKMKGDLLRQAQITQANLNIQKTKKEISLLGTPSKAEIKEQKESLKNAKAAIPVMQAKIDAVDVLKSAPGLNYRVGPNRQAREGILIGIPGVLGFGKNPGAILSEARGQGQDFAGGVHRLVSGLTLQELTDAKARGATFGALTAPELILLANSASAINDWEIKDEKGNGTGVWNIDEVSFKRELDRIQELTRKALTLSGESLVTADESFVIDEAYKLNNQALTPDNYY